MHIVYINPNATQAMTDSVVVVVQKAVPHAKVTGLTNAKGPVSIEGPKDGAEAIPGVLELVASANADGADAIVIACFDDTGLDQAQEIATCPVLGIGHSAYTMAALVGGGFCVVTSVEEAVPVIEHNISNTGFSKSCSGVHACGLAVLTIEVGSDDTIDHLSRVINATKAQSDCRTVILGCAGMAMHHRVLSQRTGVALIDGVSVSAQFAGMAAKSFRDTDQS